MKSTSSLTLLATVLATASTTEAPTDKKVSSDGPKNKILAGERAVEVEEGEAEDDDDDDGDDSSAALGKFFFVI